MSLKDLEEKIKIANEKVDAEDFEEAIQLFDEILKTDKNNLDAIYGKGNAFFLLGNFEKALKCFDKYLRINPEDEYAWNYKGIVLFNLENPKDTLKCYNKSIEINSDFDLPWFNKGLYFIENIENENARECFERAIHINPKESDYWLFKGRTYLMEDDDEALKCFEKALELNPKNDEALGLKGFLLYAKKEYRKALDCFNNALKIVPANLFVLEQKGLILIDLKKYDEAIVTFDKILEIDEKDIIALNSKGDALNNLSNFKEALFCFENILKVDPENALAWNNKGECLANLGEFKDALICYNKALKIDPKLVFTWVNKGYAYRRTGEPEKALKCFEKAISIDQEYASAWYQKGNVLTDLNREKESFEAYQKFVDLVESENIEYWKLTARRLKEFITQQKTKGTEIVVSPRKEPWYWQWSTKAEYFLEPNGEERKDLEPGAISHPGDWWTCHKDTRAGDLILLYRAGKKGRKTFQDIKYLILATSDAYSVTDDEYAFEHGWTYGCDYDVLFKFKNPLTLNEIRGEPFLDDWNAFRALFHLSAYKTEPRHWNKINELLAEKNPDYKAFLEKPTTKEKIKRIKTELELEDALFNDIKVLKKFGLDLKVVGRQVICKGEGGFMDILCLDKTDDSYVVIELKIVPADQSAFAQISYYVAWVEERIANGKPVRGIVISKGQDNRFKLAVNRDPNMEQIELSEVLSELGMKLT